MPIPRRYYEEMQAKREAEHRAAEKDRNRDFIGTGLICLGWSAVGLLVFGFALHTTDPMLGRIFQWSANIVTYGGITVTLARLYLRGERRGDW